MRYYLVNVGNREIKVGSTISDLRELTALINYHYRGNELKIDLLVADVHSLGHEIVIKDNYEIAATVEKVPQLSNDFLVNLVRMQRHIYTDPGEDIRELWVIISREDNCLLRFFRTTGTSIDCRFRLKALCSPDLSFDFHDLNKITIDDFLTACIIMYDSRHDIELKQILHQSGIRFSE